MQMVNVRPSAKVNDDEYNLLQDRDRCETGDPDIEQCSVLDEEEEKKNKAAKKGKPFNYINIISLSLSLSLLIQNVPLVTTTCTNELNSVSSSSYYFLLFCRSCRPGCF